VSIFETLWKQSGMYEESQNQLQSAGTELDRMKQYLVRYVNVSADEAYTPMRRDNMLYSVFDT